MPAKRKREEEAEFLKLNTTNNPTELDVLTFALRLLDPACPAQTTAAALLERHGKLSDVFDTPAQILAECPGVSPRLASALAAYPDLFRAYMESKNQARTRIVDTKTAFAAVQNKFFGRKTEIVVLLILDSKGYLKYMGIVNEGSVHGVPIYIAKSPGCAFCTMPTPSTSRITTQAATARPRGRTSRRPRRSSSRFPV